MTQAKAKNTDSNYGGSSKSEDARIKFGLQFEGTVSDYLQRSNDNEIFQKGDPCASDGKLGEINTLLNKVFVVLRGVQKYGNFYLNTATNAVANLKSTISAITGAISGILKSLVQRLRNWVLNKLKSLVASALDLIMTNFLRTIKESIISAVIDQIFCAFEKIVKGLFGLVGDFLYSVLGQIVQTPFCAAEQWTNALINRLVSDIDNALAPIFDNINDILGGVGKIFGSVSSAIDTILGFQGFLCGGPECPEIKEFALSPWGGPTQTQKDNFSNFNFGISSNFAGEITKTTDGLLNDFFGEDSNSSQSPGECYTGSFECGTPQVKIFGGGGSGAIADAVVNKVGQVIGTNLVNGGSGYTSPPFVQVVDPAGCGSNASGFAIMETDDDGYETGGIGGIVIDNPGSGYSDTYVGGSPTILSFIGTPNPVVVNKTINLNWDVVNADKISIKGMNTYTDLPNIGNVSFPIMEEDVIFGPEEKFTTKKFTLVAKQNNKKSANQVVEKTLTITVLKEGQSDEPINSNPPQIKTFKSSSYSAVPGDLITLTWETINSEITTIVKNSDGDSQSVPAVGSLTVTIPKDISIPSNGTSTTITYTLTASNDNAVASQNEGSKIQTATGVINITVNKLLDPDDSTGPTTPSDGDITIPGVLPPSVIIDNDTDGDGSDETGGGSGGDSVAVIDTIDIISTGIGYTGGDTVSIDDGDGGVFGIDVNQLGQIIGLNVLETGYGYTTIPNILINSTTGAGAEFRSRLKFIPLNDFLSEQDMQVVDPNKLVQVIDCVGKTRPNIGYVNGEPYSGPFHYHPKTGKKMVGTTHIDTEHQVIYDTVLESLENIQTVANTQPTSSSSSSTPSSSSSESTGGSSGSSGY